MRTGGEFGPPESSLVPDNRSVYPPSSIVERPTIPPPSSPPLSTRFSSSHGRIPDDMPVVQLKELRLPPKSDTVIEEVRGSALSGLERIANQSQVDSSQPGRVLVVFDHQPGEDNIIAVGGTYAEGLPDDTGNTRLSHIPGGRGVSVPAEEVHNRLGRNPYYATISRREEPDNTSKASPTQPATKDEERSGLNAARVVSEAGYTPFTLVVSAETASPAAAALAIAEAKIIRHQIRMNGDIATPAYQEADRNVRDLQTGGQWGVVIEVRAPTPDATAHAAAIVAREASTNKVSFVASPVFVGSPTRNDVSEMDTSQVFDVLPIAEVPGVTFRYSVPVKTDFRQQGDPETDLDLGYRLDGDGTRVGRFLVPKTDFKAHAAVLGSSGSGKTWLLRVISDEIRRVYPGVQTTVIDSLATRQFNTMADNKPGKVAILNLGAVPGEPRLPIGLAPFDMGGMDPASYLDKVVTALVASVAQAYDGGGRSDSGNSGAIESYFRGGVVRTLRALGYDLTLGGSVNPFGKGPVAPTEFVVRNMIEYTNELGYTADLGNMSPWLGENVGEGTLVHRLESSPFRMLYPVIMQELLNGGVVTNIKSSNDKLVQFIGLYFFGMITAISEEEGISSNGDTKRVLLLDELLRLIPQSGAAAKVFSRGIEATRNYGVQIVYGTQDPALPDSLTTNTAMRAASGYGTENPKGFAEAALNLSGEQADRLPGLEPGQFYVSMRGQGDGLPFLLEVRNPGDGIHDPSMRRPMREVVTIHPSIGSGLLDNFPGAVNAQRFAMPDKMEGYGDYRLTGIALLKFVDSVILNSLLRRGPATAAWPDPVPSVDLRADIEDIPLDIREATMRISTVRNVHARAQLLTGRNGVVSKDAIAQVLEDVLPRILQPFGFEVPAGEVPSPPVLAFDAHLHREPLQDERARHYMPDLLFSPPLDGDGRTFTIDTQLGLSLANCTTTGTEAQWFKRLPRLFREVNMPLPAREVLLRWYGKIAAERISAGDPETRDARLSALQALITTLETNL